MNLRHVLLVFLFSESIEQNLQQKALYHIGETPIFAP